MVSGNLSENNYDDLDVSGRGGEETAASASADNSYESIKCVGAATEEEEEDEEVAPPDGVYVNRFMTNR